jgi:glycosyl transferase family 25
MTLPTAYVINLQRSPERLAAISAQLKRAGLQWTRVDAFDGKQLGQLPWPDFGDRAYRYQWGKTPHPNELGCYLSHHRALQAFLQTDGEAAIILEDDALLADDFAQTISCLMDVAGDWDVVKLDSRHWGMPVPVRRLTRGQRLVAFTQRSTGAAGYIVNRKAAAAYVRRLLPMRVPYDQAFDQVWKFGLRMRGVLPQPVTARSGFPSDIGYAGKEGGRLAVLRRTTSVAYRGYVEVARVLNYALRDPVWLLALAFFFSGADLPG